MRNGDVGNAGEAEAAAQYCTLGHRNRCLRRRVDQLEHLAEAPVEGGNRIATGFSRALADTGKILDVAAGAEVSFDAAQNDGPQVIAIGKVGKDGDQVVENLLVHRIAHIGAIDAHMERSPVDAGEQGGRIRKIHKSSPRNAQRRSCWS